MKCRIGPDKVVRLRRIRAAKKAQLEAEAKAPPPDEDPMDLARLRG